MKLRYFLKVQILPVSFDLICDADYESQLRCEEPIILSPQRPIVVSPLSQVCVPFSKAVGLISTKYALCQVFVERSFYNGGEIANISVHVDNSKVKEACSLKVTHYTKIKCMQSGRKYATNVANSEQSFFMC